MNDLTIRTPAVNERVVTIIVNTLKEIDRDDPTETKDRAYYTRRADRIHDALRSSDLIKDETST